MTSVAILVRVSTNRQETDRQIRELRDVAVANGWETVETVETVISGAAENRADLDRILALAESGKIQKVLVHEVSRIARRNSVAHKFVEALDKAGASLYWHTQRIETRLPGGKLNPAAMAIFALMAEFARAERELLIERTISGLAAARERGVTLGRRPGITEDPETVLRRYPEVVSLLRRGKSIRDVRSRAKVAYNTVLKVKRLLEARETGEEEIDWPEGM